MGKSKHGTRSKEKQLELALSVATGILVGVDGMHYFSCRLPSAMTTRKFADQPEDLAALQQGIAEATVLSIGTAAIISGIYKWAKIGYWWIPLATNVMMTTMMATLYWNDLRMNPLRQRLKNQTNISEVEGWKGYSE